MGQIKIPEKVEANPKAAYAPLERIVDYTKEGIGGFRTLDVMHKTLKFYNQARVEMGQSPVHKEFESTLGVGKSVLAIPYLPKVTQGAIEAIKDLKSEDGKPPENFGRKAAVAVRNTAEAISVYGYVACLAIQNPAVRKVIQPIASGFDVVNDTTDIGIRAADVLRTSEMSKIAEESATDAVPEKRATEEVKNSIAETKTYSILRLIKAVCGAVAGILGLSLLATGVMLIPAIALIAISLAGTIFAISSEFYRDSRVNNLVSL